MQLNPSGQIEVTQDSTQLSDDLDESHTNPESNDNTLDLTNSSNVAIAGESIILSPNDDSVANTTEDTTSLLTEQNLANHDEQHPEDVARVIKVITAELPPLPAVVQDQRTQEQVNDSEGPLVDNTFASALNESLVTNGTANGYADDTKYGDFEQV